MEWNIFASIVTALDLMDPWYFPDSTFMYQYHLSRLAPRVFGDLHW